MGPQFAFYSTIVLQPQSFLIKLRKRTGGENKNMLSLERFGYAHLKN